MWIRIKPYFIISMVALTSTFVLWLPFLFKWDGIFYLEPVSKLSMLDIYKHWDGALYTIVAKTWYNPESYLLKQLVLNLPASYFVAHFPLYPALIWVFSGFLGYLKGMLVVPVIFNLLYIWLFYLFVKSNKLSSKPLLLSFVALFFTPRFFVIRSVPAPETIFMFLILLSVFLFVKEKIFWSSLVGGLAVLTRSPGILLFVGYCLFYLEKFIKTKKIDWRALNLLLIPLGLLAVFVIYFFQTGDFFAYFHSGVSLNLLFPPFQVFNQNATWVGTGWLEDLLFIFMFYLLAILNLWEKKLLRPVFWFVVVYFIALISIEHRDIARYSLPILPFALVSFEKFFTSKKFFIVGLLLLPALYFYSWNFMLHNVAPITDWSFFQ